MVDVVSRRNFEFGAIQRAAKATYVPWMDKHGGARARRYATLREMRKQGPVSREAARRVLSRRGRIRRNGDGTSRGHIHSQVRQETRASLRTSGSQSTSPFERVENESTTSPPTSPHVSLVVQGHQDTVQTGGHSSSPEIVSYVGMLRGSDVPQDDDPGHGLGGSSPASVSGDHEVEAPSESPLYPQETEVSPEALTVAQERDGAPHCSPRGQEDSACSMDQGSGVASSGSYSPSSSGSSQDMDLIGHGTMVQRGGKNSTLGFSIRGSAPSDPIHRSNASSNKSSSMHSQKKKAPLFSGLPTSFNELVPVSRDLLGLVGRASLHVDGDDQLLGEMETAIAKYGPLPETHETME